MSEPDAFPPQEPGVVDIGVNLTEEEYKDNWREVVQRAVDSGVNKIILTGLTIKGSARGLAMAQQWHEETGCPNLYATVGVHPYYASAWKDGYRQEEEPSLEEDVSSDDEEKKEDAANENLQNDEGTGLSAMRALLHHPLAVAAGECGLDYNRFRSPTEDQIRAFRDQVVLACELDVPLFLHEREAHEDFLSILDEIALAQGGLPPIVVHCFTGTADEAAAYIKRGFYIGFAGTICKKSRGRQLRKVLRGIPPEKLMVETDAPYMGFKKGRQSSEPADCVDVARKMGEVVGMSFDEIRRATTENATTFFRIRY